MTCSALAPATGVCLPGMTGEICGGDCDESGAITVDEILIVIRIALGEEELATCPTSDVSGDGRVTVDEVIAAVDKFRADKALTYQGNPAGLVDARFVEALRSAYFAKRKGG